jgi:predicted DCC family thiol-disulfide oxidoreductase YuxK
MIETGGPAASGYVDRRQRQANSDRKQEAIARCRGARDGGAGLLPGENEEVGLAGQAIVIFDGECAFCNRWIDFLLRFDRRDVFRFSARQSPAGASLLQQVGLPEAGAGSIILVEHRAVLLRSAAVLRMMSLLGFPFSLAAMFRLIPVTVRDAVYEWFARNRLKWFGRRTCRVPSEAERHRFF